MVGEVDERGPDGLNHALQEASSLDSQDSSPHERDESSDADGRQRAVHAEDGADDDGERDAVRSTHLAGQGDDDRADQEAEEDDGDGLAGREAE